MGQALYRKYRSRSFDELIGQEHVTKTLKNAVAGGNISHAYLFTGPRGIGKTSIARILAHAINQLEYSDKPHLDIIEIDAASNRRIEDIRDLREKVHMAPISAKYKVYIIDEVHMLTNESFNALLKTLEEPPSHVVFILATTELHKVPATITSRTQRFMCAPPSEQILTAHLEAIAKKEGISVSPEALQLIAEHADGSFRDSISLLDQISSAVENNANINEELVATLLGLPPKTALETLLNAVLHHQPETVAAELQQMVSGGVTPTNIATNLIRLVMKKAPESSAAAQLLDSLIDVMRSSYPKAKLLAILLQYSHSTIGTTDSKPKTAALQVHATAAVIAAKPQSITVAAKVKKETAPKKTEQPAAKTEASLQSAPHAAVAVDVEIIIGQWGDILTVLKAYSAPLYGALKHAEVRTGGNESTLLLAFKYPLHSRKVDDGKHKSAFVKALRQVTGISEVVIETMVDTEAKPTPLNLKPVEQSPEATIVIAAMGGGEMVEYS